MVSTECKIPMYELIVIWSTGEKEITSYETEPEAGNQISWTGIRRKVV